MNIWEVMSPMLILVFAIFAGAQIGQLVTKRTGRRYSAGWPAGIVVFFISYFALSAAISVA